MSYKIDENLAKGLQLLENNENIDEALSLINHSAIRGTTKGKSYFEIAKILKNGCPGIEPDINESRRYFDYAMKRFERTNKDSLDYRDMGDYWYYGLGNQPQDKNKALEYYDLAAGKGDEIANQHATEIRDLLAKGSSQSAPALTPDTEAKESAPSENEVPVVDSSEEVDVSPSVENENETVVEDDKIINDTINSEEILLRALRTFDSPTATDEEKKDALEFVRIASENNSVRANVLMGYFATGATNLYKKDLNEAKAYYEKGIELGSSAAKFYLGNLYLNESASFYNSETGHNLIIESAHDGYAYALSYLGDLFREKIDDPKNLAVAYRYYSLAGERGYGLAFHKLSQIDSSRMQFDLSNKHEKLALDNGYNPKCQTQNPLFQELQF